MKLGLNVMRPGLNFGLSGPGTSTTIETVRFAESLGYDSVWTSEAYGTDAIVPLTFLAAHTTTIKLGTAIMQIAARSPAMTAMTAVTLDNLSGGRVVLGLGVSGPQVVEGWHNQPFDAPLARTREYLEIVRKIIRRGGPVEFHGDHYDLPYTGEGSTGQGKAMTLTVRPRRRSIPVYIAAMGPRNVEQTFTIADGWLPLFFSPHHQEVFGEVLVERRARPGFEVAPLVPVVLGPDVDRCRNTMRPMTAFWLGAMGSRQINFYNDLARRLGYENVAQEIRDAYLQGRAREAAALVPDELIDETALCGPRERITGLFEAWRESAVTTLIIGAPSTDAIALMAELALS